MTEKQRNEVVALVRRLLTAEFSLNSEFSGNINASNKATIANMKGRCLRLDIEWHDEWVPEWVHEFGDDEEDWL